MSDGKQKITGQRAAKRAERDASLKASLRANLHKRKAQDRTRKATDAGETGAGNDPRLDKDQD